LGGGFPNVESSFEAVERDKADLEQPGKNRPWHGESGSGGHALSFDSLRGNAQIAGAVVLRNI